MSDREIRRFFNNTYSHILELLILSYYCLNNHLVIKINEIKNLIQRNIDDITYNTDFLNDEFIFLHDILRYFDIINNEVINRRPVDYQLYFDILLNIIHIIRRRENRDLYMTREFENYCRFVDTVKHEHNFN